MNTSLYIAQPRGFCAGVNRAIKIVEQALVKYKSPVYINHEIVHNRFVVENFKKQGVIFTDNLHQIPNESVYIFSAHGVSPQFRQQAKAKNLHIIDATCPLVNKVHTEAALYLKKGYKIFYIGQAEHQEYLGVAGVGNLTLITNRAEAQKISGKVFKNEKVIGLSQTTLSQDDTQEILDILKLKVPHLKVPGDICYATQNRQNAVKALAEKCDFIVVIGSENSSNSNKLVSVAQRLGVHSKLFENEKALPAHIFNYPNVGLTSGASVPENIIRSVIKKFQHENPNIYLQELIVQEETVTFSLPENL